AVRFPAGDPVPARPPTRLAARRSTGRPRGELSEAGRSAASAARTLLRTGIARTAELAVRIPFRPGLRPRHLAHQPQHHFGIRGRPTHDPPVAELVARLVVVLL